MRRRLPGVGPQGDGAAAAGLERHADVDRTRHEALQVRRRDNNNNNSGFILRGSARKLRLVIVTKSFSSLVLIKSPLKVALCISISARSILAREIINYST